MKKLIYLLFSLLLFWGCASQPETVSVEDTGSEQKVAAAENTAEEIADEPAPVVLIDVQVPHPVKETRFFRDGSVDTWIEYIYEENTTNLLTKTHFDSDGSVAMSYKFENIDGNQVKREDLDGEGRLSSYETYEYDESTNMVRKTAFDFEGSPQIISEYEWNPEGRISKLSVLDGLRGLLSHVEYSYVDGLLSSSVLFGADGMKINYFEREYDSNKLLIRETDYTSDGNVEGLVEYTYENGFLVMEAHKNRGGGLIRKYIYENDENGAPVKISLENNKGITLEMVEKSYFYTIEQEIAE